MSGSRGHEVLDRPTMTQAIREYSAALAKR
jgi:hypothetical protein